MTQKYRYIIYSVIIIILIAAILVLSLIRRKGNVSVQPVANNNPAEQTAQNPLANVVVDQIATSTVPSALPADIPWEKGVTILQNFEVKNPTTGKIQSTRSYASKKTLAQNFTAYQSYLQKGNWVISSALDQPTIKNFDAIKNGARLNITIAQETDGRVTVNVSYID